ncbi:hypothetical protein MMC22_004462 [Lobaria immixta]|nr:hypothetical protein [Lobaria immixta]
MGGDSSSAVQDHANPQDTGTRASSSSSLRPLGSSPSSFLRQRLSLLKLARHTLGLFFLLVTVVLFTASNFLASTIFADNSYSKPYFVTYLNSSVFSVFLVVFALKRLWATLRSGRRAGWGGKKTSIRYSLLARTEDEPFVNPDVVDASQSSSSHLPYSHLADSLSIDDRESKPVGGMLNARETARLGFEFCLLWFLANYFVAAGLEFTTVASVTVLTATCGIWTLIFGASVGVEVFTLNKLIGVLATLAGVVLTSSVDLSGDNEKNRGNFPHKSRKEIAIGDVLAFGSAVMYGIYTTVLKKKVGSEARVNMTLFFGFVGLFNTLVLLPGLVIFHFSGVEKFQFPPTQRIWAIVTVNSIISLVSDVCWAYAMLLTTPIVVTVGLSLTIPLSLIGQVVLYRQKASLFYWIGAAMVFLSFVLVNHESKRKVEAVRPNEQGSRHVSPVAGDSHGNSSS